LSRRHTMSGGGSGSSVTGLSVHSWFSASSVLSKCIWSTAVAQHQFYIDVRHTVGSTPSACRVFVGLLSDTALLNFYSYGVVQ